MDISPQSFLTAQQIADRWNVDIVDIHKLILTGRLVQSFLLSGRAIITRHTIDVSNETHPLCHLGPSNVRVLMRSTSGATQRNAWALTDIQEVYECSVDGIDRTEELSHLCAAERFVSFGWTLRFDPPSIQIVGEDSFQLALRTLRDTALISVETIADFEAREEPAVVGREPVTTRTAHAQDARRQRCRVAAQILWERDTKATVPALYRSEWIQRIACEGRPPTEKTFREWVKDLNPDRSPGRRTA